MLALFKNYNSLRGYLERFTLFKLGNFHIRTHKILSEDKTTFFHNHPFKYISIIWRGGYTEKYIDKNGDIVAKERKTPCIILANEKRYHRIESVLPNTSTLFITYGNYCWACTNKSCNQYKDGLYYSEKHGYCKRINDIYFIGSKCKTKALNETRHSVYQVREDCNFIGD